jgi:hypothetical protein
MGVVKGALAATFCKKLVKAKFRLCSCQNEKYAAGGFNARQIRFIVSLITQLCLVAFLSKEEIIMKKLLLSAFVLSAAFFLYPVPGQSQDKKIETAPFSPKWKVGDWWLVETFMPDLKEAITGRPKVKKPALPGYPPLNNGVPDGFKRGIKFRVEVIKDDAHLSELDDKPDGGADKEKEKEEGEKKPATEPTENYYLVTITTQGVTPTRRAVALYAVSDLALGEIRYTLGSKKRETTVKCFGTATLGSSANNLFGFPFDWPDMVAAVKKEAVLKSLNKKILQKQSAKENKDKSKTYTITLQEKKKKKGSKSRFVVTQTWQLNRPFWTEYQSTQMHARLVNWKKEEK